LLLGSYNGGADYAGAAAFAAETSTIASIYSDYLDGSSWSAMVGTEGSPPYPLPEIEGHLGSMKLLLSVPLVHAGYATQQEALAAYAADPSAIWNPNLAILAANLIATGFSDAIIRLMWEPDSGIYSNEDLVSAANYATLWAAAIETMMAVEGAEFEWAWYWGANFDETTNETAWPGDGVTHVTFDFYDQSWATGSGAPPYDGTPFTEAQANWLWAGTYTTTLDALIAFAASKGKPIGIGEFGVIDRSDNHGGNDDPTWVINFGGWLIEHAVWASYFNFNSGGNSILADFPDSEAQFVTTLGGY
jgi:hypothetical protein